MIFDWFAGFDIIRRKADIDKLVDGRDGFDKITNIYSRTKLLATCLNKNDFIKNYAKSGDKIKEPRGHKFLIHKKEYNKLIEEEINRLKSIKLYKPSVDISRFPPLSFLLQFTFTLATPYISKDDEEFYICDNTVRKDKVFKVPMVSGSTWKGNMRWVARHIEGLNHNEPDSQEIIDLFGNEKDEDEKFKRGRLNFYPTFFDQISLEVINPHDRKTKAGTVPVTIESVPEGATGTFSLLYVPFDLMGRMEEIVRHKVIKDLRIINESLEQMMLTYGFSAKKSSGFGIVKDGFMPQGVLDIKLVERCSFNNFSSLRNAFNKIIAVLKGKGD